MAKTKIEQQEAKENANVKFAWISRHVLTEEQLSDLSRIYGAVTVEQFDGTVQVATDLSDIIGRNDVIGVVLPIEMIEGVLDIANGKPVIQAINCRIPCGTKIGAAGVPETEYRFAHGGWKQIDEVKIKVHLL